MPDKTRTASTLCAYPRCKLTVWQDPNGSFSSFCGKAHRDAMKPYVNPGEVCKSCHARPVYVEDDRKHEFCGIRCARAFKSGLPRSPAVSDVSHPFSRGTSGEHRIILPVCQLVGCEEPVYVHASHHEASEFCSKKHRSAAVETRQYQGCLRCRKWPRITVNGKVSDFCSGSCRNAILEAAPKLLPLLPRDSDYGEVASQFADAWKHRTKIPTIRKIWKIYTPQHLRNVFEQYKLKLERKTGIEGGNVKRRWHGTVRACCLGDGPPRDGLCENEECSLCHILKSSFKVAKFRQRTNFGRFGAGIYTSATSSKAHSYVANKSAACVTKVVLLNCVVMGKAIKMTTSRPNLTEPPRGYDSVVGEPGDDLNYDECIVYDNDAIRPIFLVVYSEADED